MLNQGSSKCPYQSLQLVTVDNGYKVTYSVESPRIGAGSYDHVEYKHVEYVYGEKEFKLAVAEYKKVSDCIMSCYKKSNK